MHKEIQFGDYLREITVHQVEISYHDLVPEIELDELGNERPHRPGKLKLRPVDIYRVVSLYLGVRLKEQMRAVIPLAAYLVLFQLVILRQNVSEHWVITVGLLSVILGLMFFLEGLKLGLMPLSEMVGSHLPLKTGLPTMLVIVLLLGIGMTFAEPAIGALTTVGSTVSAEEAPYLFALLHDWSDVLVLVIGAGVGFAVVLGTVRFLCDWSLKPVICFTLIPAIGLAFYIMSDPELSKVLGLAWDSGAVTTGPVTVPLVLSLGIGIAAAAGRGDSSLSGFGIVTLASLFPIIAVEILAIYIAETTPVDVIIANAAAPMASESTAWHATTPFADIMNALRAIVPLVLFFFLILAFVLREKLSKPGEVYYGIALTILGMIVFNLGLTYGLAKLGGQSGSLMPAAFAEIGLVSASPLYGLELGLVIAAAFTLVLGFGATLAEPALNALGTTVENLTNGAFRKSVLMYAVSIGVGCGITLGVLKIVFAIPVTALLIPGYAVAVILTAFSTEEFVNVAWDSAGVTTGPVTVPLVLSMGLGLSEAIGAAEGFGILAMASIGPIISVLVTGQYVQWRVRRRHEAVERLLKLEGATSI